MDENTSDKTTLKGFLTKIESMYGKAQRVWVMDRGIPTEAVLREMREADQPVHYLVGTPRAKMRKMEQDGATVAGVTVAEGAGFGGGEVGGRGWRDVCAGQERRTAG